MKNRIRGFYFNYLWWVWQSILVSFTVFFFILGIQVFIKAYQLKNPFDFILTFFASNLMILISLVLFIGLVYRMIGVFRLVYKKADKHKDTYPEKKDRV